MKDSLAWNGYQNLANKNTPGEHHLSQVIQVNINSAKSCG